MANTLDKTDAPVPVSAEIIEARAHQIARDMPDMFPFGYAMFLATEEAAEGKL